MRINGFDFRETCSACPEQYVVFAANGRQVGYVRLRWGYLSAEYPYCGGELVYEFSWDDGWLGMFPNDSDRTYHLGQIANALQRKIEQEEDNYDSEEV